MKLVKSILLGSAAGLSAVAGAQAADLPMRKAAPVEFVRVCSAYGAGFFYIPGTDTCLRVSGLARGEYHFSQTRSYNSNSDPRGGSLTGGNVSGFSALGIIGLDARTQTGYGTLRTFINYGLAYNTGGFLTCGPCFAYSQAFSSTAQDGQFAQTFIFLNKAFIQFAGLTAGRTSSFFNFYQHDVEMMGLTAAADDYGGTTLFAYTATFGNGFSATISIQDPLTRRTTVFTRQDDVFGGGVTNVPVTFDPATGLPTTFAPLDVRQRERLPDFVGALRFDGTWGSAQLSAAAHEINVGKYQEGLFAAVPGVPGAPVPGAAPFVFGGFDPGTAVIGPGGIVNPAMNGSAVPGNFVPLREPQSEIGFAVQGGVKVNLPMIAPGDVFWLQAAYGQGAMGFTQLVRLNGFGFNQAPVTGRFNVSQNDAVVFANGEMKLTESEAITAAFLHYWTPQWRSALFGSYGEAHFPSGSRGPLGPMVDANFTDPNFLGQGPVAIPQVAPGAPFISAATAAAGQAAARQALAFNSALRDYSHLVVGANLIWSPVKNLDIGAEVVYHRIDFLRGRVADFNKFGTVGAGGAVTADPTGGTVAANIAGLPAGTPLRTVSSDDVFLARFRVQRDF